MSSGTGPTASRRLRRPEPLQDVGLDLGLLILWNGLFFVAAYQVFVRTDVR